MGDMGEGKLLSELPSYKSFKIKFPTKKSAGGYVYLPQEWSYSAQKIFIFEIQGGA